MASVQERIDASLLRTTQIAIQTREVNTPLLAWQHQLRLDLLNQVGQGIMTALHEAERRRARHAGSTSTARARAEVEEEVEAEESSPRQSAARAALAEEERAEQRWRQLTNGERGDTRMSAVRFVAIARATDRVRERCSVVTNTPRSQLLLRSSP